MSPKKLIEVDLPLDAINKDFAREKSIRHGNPSTLHLWWARKPLAAARAVLWASLVDDPSAHPEKFPTPEAQATERKRLHAILQRLVKWENTNDPHTLAEARAELPDPLPEFLDPFAGGGSIPLEAQRLGLTVHAHDLNPIAVMLNKAMIEIPPSFAGLPPVHPDPQRKLGLVIDSNDASGLAEDVKYYGTLLRAKAFDRIGRMYPRIMTPDGEANVIAWLWARTVKCPNPACGCDMPLVSSFMLSTKKGREAWVVPHLNKNDASSHIINSVPTRINNDAANNDATTHTNDAEHFIDGNPAGFCNEKITYTVHTDGTPPKTPKTGRGKFTCAVCGAMVGTDYLHSEFSAHRDSRRMTAIVAEGRKGRVYLSPNDEHERAADVPMPEDYPDGMMPNNPRWFSPPIYGMTNYASLFTHRQLTMLTTLCDLIPEIMDEVENDARRLGRKDAKEYAEAVAVYLAFVVDKLADYHSVLCSWHTSGEKMSHTFTRQALPMVWDYAECNPFCNSSGSFDGMLDWVVHVIDKLPMCASGEASQHNAQVEESLRNVLISTDPPYYDNIGYADLSDYFYIWMRRNLRGIYPELFRSMLTPKTEELIASPYRHNNDDGESKRWFEDGMLNVCKNLYTYASEDYPTTIYYAYKQKDTDDDGVTSTGWETMLNAVIKAGFQVTGTWPIRTELTNRTLAQGTNALASSIVLVLRKRPKDAPGQTTQNFERELKAALADGLATLRNGGIAPVDVPQSAIGKGMAVYSRYSRVVDMDGHVLSVGDVLRMINAVLDDPEGGFSVPGELDAESRFCVEVYRLNGFNDVSFDDANKIANARTVVVEAMKRRGIVHAEGGRVRLSTREELREADSSVLWVAVQKLAYAMDTGGVEACARVAGKMEKAARERAREMAYYLYNAAETRGWAREAYAYNNIVVEWQKIIAEADKPIYQQKEFDFGGKNDD